METMSRYSAAIAVSRSGEGQYKSELDPGYLIGTAINGGYLMAVLQSAALAESPHEHAVSSSFHFLRPGAGGPVNIAVETVKSGRTVSTMRAVLSQDGRPTVTGTFATATLDSGALPEYAPTVPELPAYADCAAFDPRLEEAHASEFSRRVELRFSPTSYQRLTSAGADPVPELYGYVRLPASEGGIDDALSFLPMAVDSLPPVVMVFGSWRWAPTVELTWNLRAVPAPGPLTFRSRAEMVSDGWFDENVDLWDSAGTLVAQCRQLARVGR